MARGNAERNLRWTLILHRVRAMCLAALVCSALGSWDVAPARAKSATSAWEAVDAQMSGRSSLASATDANHRIYLIGGYDYPNSPGAVNTVEVFDPSNTQLSSVAPLPGNGRSSAAAVASPDDGRIYVFGGTDRLRQRVAAVDAYHPATGDWIRIAGDMPTPREALAARASGRLIYTFGGVDRDGNVRDVIEVFDTTEQSWVKTYLPMPAPRAKMAAATGPDGLFYLVGGVEPAGMTGALSRFDPNGHSWTELAPMPTPRSNLAAVFGGDGKLYALGGVNNESKSLDTVEVYGPIHNTWSALPSMPRARKGLAAGTDVSGALYAFGGDSPGDRPFSIAYPSSIDRYTASSVGGAVWLMQRPMQTGRQGLAAVTDESGRLYAVGGFSDQDARPLSTVEIYDPADGMWSQGPNMPTPRAYLGATSTGGGLLSAFQPTIYTVGGATRESSMLVDPDVAPSVSVLTYPDDPPFGSGIKVQSTLAEQIDSIWDPALTPTAKVLEVTYAWRANGGLTRHSPPATIDASVAPLAPRCLIEGDYFTLKCDSYSNVALQVTLPPFPPEASTAEIYLYPAPKDLSDFADVRYSHSELRTALAAIIDPTVPEPTRPIRLKGSISKTAGTKTLIGTGTTFTSQLSINQRIWINGGLAADGTPLFGVEETAVVQAIASDTQLTVDQPWTNTASDQNVIIQPLPDDLPGDVRQNPQVILTSLPPVGAPEPPSSNTTGGTVGAVERYIPATNSWSSLPALPTPRWELAVIADKSGRVYAIGGQVDPQQQLHDDGSGVKHAETPPRGPARGGSFEIYDPATNAWSTPDFGLGDRVLPAATLGLDGRIYLIGGNDASQQVVGGAVSGGVSDSLMIYDPATNEWGFGAPMPTPRQGLAAVTGPNGKIYAIGGDTVGGVHLSTVEVYDPCTNTWAPGPSLNVGRRDLAATVGKIGGQTAIFAIGGNPGQTPYTTVESLFIDASPPPTAGCTPAPLHGGYLPNANPGDSKPYMWSSTASTRFGIGEGFRNPQLLAESGATWQRVCHGPPCSRTAPRTSVASDRPYPRASCKLRPGAACDWLASSSSLRVGRRRSRTRTSARFRRTSISRSTIPTTISDTMCTRQCGTTPDRLMSGSSGTSRSSSRPTREVEVRSPGLAPTNSSPGY